MGRSAKWVCALLSASLVLTACGGGGRAESGSSGTGIPDEYKDLVLVGSSQGGSGYSYMVAASKLFNKYLGMNTSVQSGGTQENALLITRGDVKFGITSPGDLMSAAKDKKAVEKTKLRTVFAMFNVSYLVVVPKDSKATSLADLKGQRIAIGTPGGGEYPLFYESLKCLGMKKTDFKPQAIGKDEAVTAYKDGNIDAWQAQGPNPSSQFVELIESQRGAKVIGAGEDLVDCLAKANPDEFVKSTIPAKTYPGQAMAIPTVDEWFYATASEDLPEDVAYKMTKVLDEHHDELVKAYPGAETSTAKNTAKVPGFPLHPGTKKYLKEKGLVK